MLILIDDTPRTCGMKYTLSQILTVLLLICLGRVDSQAQSWVDRLGRPIPAAAKHSPDQTLGASDCRAGFFEVQFVDEAGLFSAPGGIGDARCAVVCAVLSDLSQLFNRPANAGAARIRVEAYVDPTDNAAAFASAVYRVDGASSSGLLDGALWQAINSSGDTYAGWNNTPDHHARIVINFAHAFNLDPDAVSFTDVDLYSVVLHEMLHALGLASFVGADGNSVLAGSTWFTRYDSFLQLNSNAGLTPLVAPNNGCYELNPAPYDRALLQTPCSQSNTPVVFAGVNLFNAAVYTPQPWRAGGSLSHFDENCADDGLERVLHYEITPGEIKRLPHAGEVAALCDLGYAISGVYGAPVNATRFRDDYAACDGLPAGVNDRPSGPFVSTEPIVLAFDDLAANDVNTDKIACLEVIGTSGALLSRTDLNSGEQLTVDPDPGFRGTIVLRYLPQRGLLSGNITYVFIDVEFPALPPCTWPTANLLCNGDFENSLTSGHLNIDDRTCYQELTRMQAWFPTFSPDIYERIQDSDTFIRHDQFVSDDSHMNRFGPDSWDKLPDNRFYLYGISGIEGVFQPIEPAQSQFNTQFIVRTKCYPIRFGNSDQPYDIPEVRVYFDSISFCDENDVYRTRRFNDPYIKLATGIPLFEWSTAVSEPFTLDENDKWVLFLPHDPVRNPDAFINMLLDDLELIPLAAYVPAQIKTFVNQVNDCAGAPVDVQVRVCKDFEDSELDFELKALLPPGVQYLSGDFDLNNGELLARPAELQYDSLGCGFFFMRVAADPALADGLPHYINIVRRGAEEFVLAAAELRPRRSGLRLRQELNACRNNGLLYALDLSNSSLAPLQNFELRIRCTPPLAAAPTEVFVNGAAWSDFSADASGIVLNKLALAGAAPTGDPPRPRLDVRFNAAILQSTQALEVSAEVVPPSGCARSTTNNVTVVENSVDLGGDVLLCDAPLQIGVADVYNSYQWSNGAATPTIELNTSTPEGMLSLTAIDAGGCEHRDAVLVEQAEGIQLLIDPADVSADPGASFRVTVKQNMVAPSGDARSFSLTLRYDQTMLELLSPAAPRTVVDGARRFAEHNLRGLRPAGYDGETLLELEFMALLGDTAQSRVEVFDFTLDECLTAGRAALEFTASEVCAADHRQIVLGAPLTFGVVKAEGGTVRVSVNAPTHMRAHIVLSDVLGRRVATVFSGELESGAKEFTVNEAMLSPGLYFCSLYSASGVRTETLRVD